MMMMILRTWLLTSSMLSLSRIQAQQCQVGRRSIPSRSNNVDERRTSPTTYRVGAFGIRGAQQAYENYNATFQDYLNVFVAPSFEHASGGAINFELVPIFNDNEVGYLDYLATSSQLDFLFMHTGAHSCMESEIGLRSLATVISKRNVNGEVYELNQYGGVLFTSASSNITRIEDVVNRTTACVALEAFGSGQLQFRELYLRGIHHLQDVAQIVFMEKQPNVVHAVIQGQIDVGYVRTDQLERTLHPTTGQAIDFDKDIRVLQDPEMEPLLSSDGTEFPFPSSTKLYPEWSFSAYAHVPDALIQSVQEAVLQMPQHAAIVPALLECFAERACGALNLDGSILTIPNQVDSCHQQCIDDLLVAGDDGIQRCDTSLYQSLAAYSALQQGNMAGWTPTASYAEIRTMQEDLGFLAPNKKCIRTQELETAVTCPPGHFPKQNMLQGCEELNVDCFGFTCLCKPCVKAFDVDFFAWDQLTVAQTGIGCNKFEVCGIVEQGHDITFYAIDNRQRGNATQITVDVLNGNDIMQYSMQSSTNNPFEYQVTINRTLISIGEHILLVKVDGEQIPESPFRIEIEQRDCYADTKDPYMIPTATGECICQANVSTELWSGRCIRYAVLLPSIIFPSLLLLTCLIWFLFDKKRKAEDRIWRIDPSELKYHEPHPRILGRGTFGLVLLAEFRGTQVAVKRVLPPSSDAKTKLSKFDFRDDDTDHQSVVAKKIHKKGMNFMKKNKMKRLGMADAATMAMNDINEVEQQSGQGPNHRRTSTKRKSSLTPPPKSATSLQSIGAPSPTSPPPKSILKGKRDHTNGAASPSSIAFTPASASASASALASSKTTSKRNSFFGSSGSISYKQLEKEFKQEMRLLSRLRHPCITTTMGAVISKHNEPMLIMEHMELGSLYDLLHNDSMVLDGEIMLPILRDIARGLRFLHSATPQIVHCDLKSANILVDNRFHGKVSDFGLSRKRYFFQDKASSVAGTPFWMAPELLRRQGSNTTMSDVYSFGIVVNEVLSRRDPYGDQMQKFEADEILRLVADDSVCKRPTIPRGITSESEELVKACWRQDALARPTAEEISVRLEMLDTEHLVIPAKDRRSSAGLSSNNSRHGTKTSAEDLLSQLFPAHIAAALREGRKVEPEHHDAVTVYFSDIVNYTSIAADLSPTKVSSLLDRLYTKFDQLCDIHDVFKVETVGDAYMTATNVDTKDPHHVERMASFALDAIVAASSTLIDEHDPSKGYVEIRSGFNTGPAVAHVVGTRNPRYSIIGDTVNTAARMESNSLPGKLQCSEESAQLLIESSSGMFDVTRRGVFNIKGKGDMTLYWVDKHESIEKDDDEDTSEDGDTFDTNHGGSIRMMQVFSSNPYPMEPIMEVSKEFSMTDSGRTYQRSLSFTNTNPTSSERSNNDDSQKQPFALSQDVWMNEATKAPNTTGGPLVEKGSI